MASISWFVFVVVLVVLADVVTVAGAVAVADVRGVVDAVVAEVVVEVKGDIVVEREVVVDAVDVVVITGVLAVDEAVQAPNNGSAAINSAARNENIILYFNVVFMPAYLPTGLIRA